MQEFIARILVVLISAILLWCGCVITFHPDTKIGEMGQYASGLPEFVAGCFFLWVLSMKESDNA